MQILIVLKLRYRLFLFWFAGTAAFCAAEGFTSTAKLNLAAPLLPAATCGCFFTLVFVPCKVPLLTCTAQEVYVKKTANSLRFRKGNTPGGTPAEGLVILVPSAVLLHGASVTYSPLCIIPLKCKNLNSLFLCKLIFEGSVQGKPALLS